MDTLVGYTLVGVMSAAGAGFSVGRAWIDRSRRRERAQRALGGAKHRGRAGRMAERLRHGVAPLVPLAEALLRRPFVRRVVDCECLALRARGIDVARVPLLSTTIAATLVLVGIGWLATGSPVFGIAVAGCALVTFSGWAKSDAERRVCALRDEIPDALRSVGVCFRAGLSLMQTLRQTGSEMKGPLGDLFLASARLLETGATAGEALAVFRCRSDASELAFIAVALDVQHASGGSLASVLDAARESVEGEIELERSLRVQTAQAKLSARIVTIMPFVLVGIFSLMSPGFLAPFFESLPGMLLLAAALAMQAVGVLAVHRLLDVSGGVSAVGEGILGSILAAGAAASAFGVGWMLWRLAETWRRRVRYRAAVAESVGGSGEQRMSTETAGRPTVDEQIIAYGIEVSQRLLSPLARTIAPLALRRRGGVEARAAPAGVAGRLTDAGFWEARFRLALMGAAGGAVVGCLVTVELGMLLAIAGAVLGWQALPRALSVRSRRRAEAMERDLSEMLDVVALGMRSGLSFDRSLEMYTGHFETMLAETLRAAHRQWACGLIARDEALREVAASYASPLLARVMENIVRSLRFGSTLADNLEDAAREARAGYKARKQEQVAKAPVKMMVPTGVLILPAMLMLVLGPVLLELAGGF